MSTLTLKKDSTTTATYSYTYDSLGNITQVKENNVLKLSYEYDSLNQLVRENNAYANKTWKYTYDKTGNITGKYVYAYTTGTLPSTYQDHISYGYSTGAWGDMLTSYNGTTISYDTIGNPTNWRNGITNLTWNGRELNSFVKGSYTHSFKYNADGIRTEQTKWYTGSSMAEIYHYVLDGTKIVSEYTTTSSSSTPSNVKYYFYDAAGSIAGFEYNGTTYYFQKNLQGDIIRICNISGNTVVEYTYDAWGKVLSVTGSLASTVGQANPFRYRGYYYDTETGLYYLLTRYYDPEVGRFLNADGYIGANGDILGYNMFAYCSNNPVMGYDPSGEGWLEWLIGAAVVVACAVAVVVTAGSAAAGVAAVAAVVNGTAAATTASTVAAGAFIGSSLTYATAVTSAAVSSKSVDEFAEKGNWGTVAETVIGGVVGGLYGYSLARQAKYDSEPHSDASSCDAECFVAGTMALTDAGLKPIESIKEGDIVESENPETGEKGQRRVVQTFINETFELVHLFVEDDEIVTTLTHPFWVIDVEWCSAIEIRAGDILKLADGSTATVTATWYERLETPVKVYNFEVEDFHTYYVSEQSVLVHNRCSSVDRMSRQEANNIKKDIRNSKDVTFRTKADAESFITKEYPGFSRDVAGQRTAQGWHYDSHEINEVIREHINIFSKTPKFNSHIFWEN